MKALILDMDGVMIDSEVHWKKREQAFFRQWIPRWENEDQVKIIGMSVQNIYRILAKEYDFPLSEREYLDKIDEIASEIYATKTELLPGCMELIEKAGTRIPLGLASSAMRKWIEKVMDRFELYPFFKAVVSAEDIKGPSKPDPAIYLFTAKKLGVAPKDCVVVEDAMHGIAAAKKAGMRTIGLRNGFNDYQDLSAADWVVRGLAEIDLDTL